MKKYIIEVKGEIVANAGVHYAQNWVCGSMGSSITNNDYFYNKETRTVNSNLVLNENIRAVPYAIYHTGKGIVAKNKGNIAAYPGYGAAWEYYKENIGKILNLLKCDIPNGIEQVVYHGLFTDVFSVLELFLSDFILCMIYSNEIIYEKAAQYYRTSNSSRNEVYEIEKQVHDFFFNRIVYHNFDKVKDIFSELIDIDFPNTMGLKMFLHKRNNIVHRFSLSNIDRMRIVEILSEDVENLIKESNVFVRGLIDNINKK